MPLSRSYAFEPIEDVTSGTFLFPMMDGDHPVMVTVSCPALRERADRDGLPSNVGNRYLLDRYRDAVERIASDEYESGRWSTSPTGGRAVRVPNGRIEGHLPRALG